MSMSRCETGGCCGLLAGLLGTSINQIQTIYIHLQSCLHAPTHRDKDACPHTIRAGAEVELVIYSSRFSGKKFDSSFDRQQPFTFTIGVGQVIPGWDQVRVSRVSCVSCHVSTLQGLLGVCAGEERHLVVPSPLAYGDRGAGDTEL